MKADTALEGGHSRWQTRAHSRSRRPPAGCWPDGLSGLWEAFGRGRKDGLRAWEQIGEQGLGSQGPGWRKDTQARADAPSSGAFLPPGARPGQGQAWALRGPVQGTWDGALAKMLRLRPESLEVPGSGQHRHCVVRAGRWEERWEGVRSRPGDAASPGLLALEAASTAHTRAFWDGAAQSEAGAQAACEPDVGWGTRGRPQRGQASGFRAAAPWGRGRRGRRRGTPGPLDGD